MRRRLAPALAGAAAAAATDWGYLALIRAQNANPPAPDPGVVPFVSVYIAAIAAAALLAVVLILNGRSRSAETLLVAAATASAALGFISIVSIGLALLITAGLLAVATTRVAARHRHSIAWMPPVLAGLGAVAVLIVGFFLTGTFAG
jgi:hypothetical protein